VLAFTRLTFAASRASLASSSRGYATQAPGKVTAALVGKLRKLSPAGVLECKAALESANGDIDKALQILIAKGNTSKAKEGRIAAEGRLSVATSRGRGIAIELNSETDFVARSEGFQLLAERISRSLLSSTDLPSPAGGSIELPVDRLLESVLTDDGTTIKSAISSLTYSTGEKIQLQKAYSVQVPGGVVGGYTHHGKLAALVELQVEPNLDPAADIPPELAKTAFNIAVNVVGFPPQFLSKEQVPEEWAREKKSAQPDLNMDKLMEEVVLMEQPLTGSKTSVRQALQLLQQTLSRRLRIAAYHRLELSPLSPK
jgi:elongation factor Ts